MRPDKGTVFFLESYLFELEKLIEIDSTSPLGSEALHRLDDFFERFGIVRCGDAALWLRRWPSSQLWVYGHVDTKPALGAWESDPFRLTRVGDRLIARGVSDSKFQLLNALQLCTDAPLNILIDGAEEIGAADAGIFLAGEEMDGLVLVDGAAQEPGDIYSGVSGQLDGEIRLDTGHLPHHPAHASRREIFDALAAVMAAAEGLHFNLTRIEGGDPIRSLTLETLRVGFDLRYTPGQSQRARAFLDRKDVFLKQDYPPMTGRRTRKHHGVAGFSNPLGQFITEVERLWVVPGGRGNNNTHRPNEWIATDQILTHRETLRALLTRIGKDK